jgi:glycogen synthase
MTNSEEEDPEEYPFPLTLKQKKPTGSGTITPTINGLDGAS